MEPWINTVLSLVVGYFLGVAVVFYIINRRP
jgi:hypothetical protein